METALFDRTLRPWPYINAELFYERGVDDLPTYPVKQNWQEVLQGAYEVYLSGGYFVYYYSNTAWDLVKPDPEPPGMQRFQILKENLSVLPTGAWKQNPTWLSVGLVWRFRANLRVVCVAAFCTERRGCRAAGIRLPAGEKPQIRRKAEVAMVEPFPKAEKSRPLHKR